MSKSVYLSPSMQENNMGASNFGTEEQRMNQVADVTERILRQHDIVVYRNKPDMTLAQMVSDSNNKKPDIHFAIHSNAGGGRGCEVYCHRFGGNGEKLARAVYAELSPITPTEDRGVGQGYNFYGQGKHMYELAYTNAPATLVETAFHDNKDDAAWIINNIEVIGMALAKGILAYFGIQYKESSNTVESGTKPEFKPYLVKITIEDLNIRKGPGTNYEKVGKYTDKGIFTIVEESEGKGATKWGLLKSYVDKRNGWISLDYTTKV